MNLFKRTIIVLPIFLIFSFVVLVNQVSAQAAAPAQSGPCTFTENNRQQCQNVNANPPLTLDGVCRQLCDNSNGARVNCQLSNQTACPTENNNTRQAPRVNLFNPIGVPNADPTEIYGLFVDRILGIVGSLALLVFIIGGFFWLTSAGNEERVKTGTRAMLYAAIGLLLVFSAYGILRTVIDQLTR